MVIYFSCIRINLNAEEIRVIFADFPQISRNKKARKRSLAVLRGDNGGFGSAFEARHDGSIVNQNCLQSQDYYPFVF